MGSLKLGRFIALMRYSVVSGFMSGVGIILIILQVPGILGSAAPPGGVLGTIQSLPDLTTRVPPAEVALGLATLAVLFVIPKNLRRRVPVELIVLVFATLASVLILAPEAVLGIAERDGERPVVAAYERIGIGPFFTLGLRQGVEAIDFQFDLGFEAIAATRFGAFAFDADIGVGPDERLLLSLPLRYSYHDPSLPSFRNIDLTAGWLRLVNESGEPEREQVNFGAAVSLALGSSMSLIPRLAYSYELLESRQLVDARASFRTNTGSGTSVKVDTGIMYDEEISFAASVTVSSAFPEQRQNLFLQQNVVTREFAGFWTRYADESVDPYDFNAAMQIPIDTGGGSPPSRPVRVTATPSCRRHSVTR